MPLPISVYLNKFPEQANLVGEMLLGFTDIESFTIELVSQALNGDGDTATRLLYRLKGADDRLNAADAILRPHMRRLKLLGPYSQWLGALRKCKAIRNQYAHCAWDANGDKLYFTNLFDAAQSIDEDMLIYSRRISLTLLKEQHAYFRYTLELTTYLMLEGRVRLDASDTHDCPMPKSRAAPKLHIAPR